MSEATDESAIILGVELPWTCPECHKKIAFGKHADSVHIKLGIEIHIKHHGDRPVEKPRLDTRRRYYAGEPE